MRWALSHPCFELWLILHFGLHTSYLTNQEARAKLRTLDCAYDNKGVDFDRVWGLRREALKNADLLDKRQRANVNAIIDRNPWTTVHELVALLLRLTERMPAIAIPSQRVPSPNRRGVPR